MKPIILASCAAFVWVFILRMQRFKFKPLNCEHCMAGWFCLALCLAAKVVWYEVPFMMATAMVATIILTAYLKKL